MNIFKLPDLGEGLQEAEIIEWHVKEGQQVKADQPLLSVETAKAIVDIPSPHDGRIAKLFGKKGDIMHLGAALVGFEGAANDAGTVVGTMPHAPSSAQGRHGARNAVGQPGHARWKRYGHRAWRARHQSDTRRARARAHARHRSGNGDAIRA